MRVHLRILLTLFTSFSLACYKGESEENKYLETSSDLQGANSADDETGVIDVAEASQTTVTTPGGGIVVGPEGVEAWVDDHSNIRPVPRPTEHKQPMDTKELAENISVVACVAKSSFLPMEPIAVGFEVRNSTEVPLELGGFGLPDRTFWVEVFDKEMRTISHTRYYSDYFERSKNAGQMNSPPALKPGTSHQSTLIANWPYDMTLPGQYLIVINVPLVLNIGKNKGKFLYMKSDPIEVEVDWGDPILLLNPEDQPQEPIPSPFNRQPRPVTNPTGPML